MKDRDTIDEKMEEVYRHVDGDKLNDMDREFLGGVVTALEWVINNGDDPLLDY